jgi:hypothetical protein
MSQYSIVFNNQSTNDGTFCCFQQDEDMKISGVMSLAWFAKRCDTNSSCTFNWTIDYSFIWAETGILKPGITFQASQTIPADLAQNNLITLDYDGAFHFGAKGSATPQGSLYVEETGNIPLQKASVGIGMSHAGTFVVQAEPNMDVTFTPHPTYYVAFGDFEQGEVLDVQQMTEGAKIEFPPNVYVMYATLDAANTWHVSATPPTISKDKSSNFRKTLAV